MVFGIFCNLDTLADLLNQSSAYDFISRHEVAVIHSGQYV